MSDATQEIEQVSWTIGDRRAGKQIDLSRTDQRCARVVRYAQQFEAVRGSLTVVLDEVRLIKDDPGPWDTMKARGILGEDSARFGVNPGTVQRISRPFDRVGVVAAVL